MTIAGFSTLASCPAWAAALINHLWQSTAVVLVAWLLSLLLRANSARVRYAIWMTASIKFLLPFALLSSLGALWAKPNPSPQVGPSLYVIVEEIGQPFRQARIPDPGAALGALPSHSIQLTSILFAALWLCGFVVMLVVWIARWRRAAGMARNGEPMTSGREFDALRLVERSAGIKMPIHLVLSSSEVEPGVFGLMRPVLLWPLGLSERLDAAQIEAIMSHEVEHVSRHDNLSAAIHTLIEAIFWFHPLVRWMSARLNEERERACDERVIERSARPETYAESILKVCAFCLEPPTPCISGVSGADLKERIFRIMTRRSGVALSSARKLVLFTTALLILAAPLGFGVLRGQNPPSTLAPSHSSVSTVDLPKYEVATIKSTAETEDKRMMMLTPDGTSMHGVDVQMLLQQGFGVERDRILGAPAWVNSNRYDIEAKVAPEDAPKIDKLKLEQRREMLLPFLEERFNLKYHHETRELPMYALVMAKGGPRLTEAKPGTPTPAPDGPTPAPGTPGPDAKLDGPPKDRVGNMGMMRMSPGDIEAHGGTTAFLAHALSALVGRSIVDKTGLTGNYDFTLNWIPDNMSPTMAGGPDSGQLKGDASENAGGPTLFTALEEQLGLKLEATKGMVDVIVIDHIDLPSEN
jgi:bla regulator protein BlaR1